MSSKEPQQLSRRAVKEILNNTSHHKDAALSALTSSEAYLLEDGALLLVYDDEDEEDDDALIGALWQSRAAVEGIFDRTADSRPTHLLTGRLTHGRDFVNAVPQLIDELAEMLERPRHELDYSRESIRKIDKLVRERFQPDQRLAPRLFSSLVAYVGESSRRISEGIWEMRKCKDSDTWEPWITTSAGQEYAPFIDVYEELYEHSDQIGSLVRAIPTN